MSADFLKQVGNCLSDLVGDSDSPLVVYASAWPFLRELRSKDPADIDRLLDVVLDVAGERSVLMPTFSRGFVDGVCDLDSERSTTGLLSEALRNRYAAQRTRSAFFSYAVVGLVASELVAMHPVHAWGPGSLYEWMEQENVCFLMFGTHPTHCSYLHRLEWLARDVIPYRFDKTFRGRLIHQGSSSDGWEETLYVRRLDPPILNDFTVLLPHLAAAGMREVRVNGITIASYSASSVLAGVLPALRANPALVAENVDDCGVGR